MNTIEDTTYLAHLNSIRQEGYRPCMVAVMVAKGKVGLCEAWNYIWYEFPQGGIEPGELPHETIEREIEEELGQEFYRQCNFPAKSIKYLFDVRSKMKVKGKLKLVSGEFADPKGKEYIVYLVELQNNIELPKINKDENGINFKQCLWVNASEARELIKKTTHPVKREIALRAINEVEKLNLIS